MTLSDLGLALNNAFGGNTDGKFRDGENEYDMNIRLDRSDRKNVSDVENFSIRNAYGQMVRLKQFAKIEETDSGSALYSGAAFRGCTPAADPTSRHGHCVLR